VAHRERTLIGAYLDRSDRERLAERAQLAERTLSAEIRLAIREHLEASSVSFPEGRCCRRC
jgi:hypothetical protein